MLFSIAADNVFNIVCLIDPLQNQGNWVKVGDIFLNQNNYIGISLKNSFILNDGNALVFGSINENNSK